MSRPSVAKGMIWGETLSIKSIIEALQSSYSTVNSTYCGNCLAEAVVLQVSTKFSMYATTRAMVISIHPYLLFTLSSIEPWFTYD